MTVTDMRKPRKESELQEVREFTLYWLNERRKELGMPTLAELPVGNVSAGRSCVVARGLSNGWKAVTGGQSSDLRKVTPRPLFLKDKVERKTIDHPYQVRRFIVLFDNGGYPDLIDKGYGK